MFSNRFVLRSFRANWAFNFLQRDSGSARLCFLAELLVQFVFAGRLSVFTFCPLIIFVLCFFASSCVASENALKVTLVLMRVELIENHR